MRAEREGDTGTEKRGKSFGRISRLVLTLIDLGLGCLINEQLEWERRYKAEEAEMRTGCNHKEGNSTLPDLN